MHKRHLFRSLATAAAGVLASGLIIAPSSAEPSADTQNENVQAPGGSNYNFFNLDGCDREPYGVLKNFHTETETIRNQLTALHNGGQERLIIGIFHGRGLDSGTLMDSTGGDLDPQYRDNLRDLLAMVDDIGFDEVEVAMHVLGPNNPNEWDTFHEDLYQENWQLIQNIRPIVAESGVHYRLNLGNELTPAPGQDMTLEYAQRLWNDYTAAYGKEDTVGFSVIGMRPERIAQIPKVYGDNPPNVFDFHFYGNDEANEYQQFVGAHRQMRDMGYEQGWVIGETYYDDAEAAANIRRAVDDTGQRLYWLTQWPLTRDRNCDHVDVTPPADFGAFAEHGFADPAESQSRVETAKERISSLLADSA